jgi:ribonuclease BN (tRNA processing enzyme)
LLTGSTSWSCADRAGVSMSESAAVPSRQIPGQVRVTVAGSGDAFGSGGRLQACLHVQPHDREEAVLLDCGTSALTGLKRLGLEPNDVTVVAVSHLHGDHFGGLPFLLLDGQFRHRHRPLHLVGPPGLWQRLAQAMEVLFPDSTKVARRFATHVHELQPAATLTVAGVTVATVAVDHAAGAPALGLRLEVAGRVIAYSGDTAWTDALVGLADGADLLVCEAYTATRPIRYHLDLPSLRANRHRLRCARLLLTHPSPDLLAHRADLEPDLELAADGTIIELG